MKYKKIKSFILTVDGKSSSGKSTAAKLLAKKFQIPHLSSGLLYRWAAKKILDKKPRNKISHLRKCFKKFNYNSLKKTICTNLKSLLVPLSLLEFWWFV